MVVIQPICMGLSAHQNTSVAFGLILVMISPISLGIISAATPNNISIDAESNKITLELSGNEIEMRLTEWEKPPARYKRGVLAKYAASVASASEGAVTDKYL